MIAGGIHVVDGDMDACVFSDHHPLRFGTGSKGKELHNTAVSS